MTKQRWAKKLFPNGDESKAGKKVPEFISPTEYYLPER